MSRGPDTPGRWATGKDTARLAGPLPRVVVKDEGRVDDLAVAVLSELAQEEDGGGFGAGLDLTLDNGTQAVTPSGLEEFEAAAFREDEVGAAVVLEEGGCPAHDVVQGAVDLVAGGGDLRVVVGAAGTSFDVGRIAEDDIEAVIGVGGVGGGGGVVGGAGALGGAVGAEVGLEDGDAVGEVVEGDGAAGHVGEVGLNLEGGEGGERFGGEEEGDDAASGAELKDVIRERGFDEIREEGGVEGEAVAFFLLEDLDAAVEESVEGFVFFLHHRITFFI